MRILRPFIRTSMALVLPMAAHAQTQEGTFPHWNGPSAGLSLGRGWGTNEAAVRPGADEWSQSFSTPAFDAGRIPSTPEVPVKGTFFSAHGGYDLRLGNFVVGAAGDIQLGRRSGSHTLNLPAKPRDANLYWVDITTTTTQQVNRTASLRARLGVIGNEQWMAYLTGGMVHAGLRHRYRMDADDSRDHQTVDSKTSAFGLLLGGGLEVPIKDRYRARLEYRYMDLGEQAYRSTATGRPDNLRSHFDITFRDRHHELMLGVVYALGQPRPPAARIKKERTQVDRMPPEPIKAAPPPPTTAPEKSVVAQNALTNKDLIQLAEHGMGDKVILGRIAHSPDHLFDISTDALIALKKAGLSDAVIAQVIELGNAGSHSRKEHEQTSGMLPDTLQAEAAPPPPPPAAPEEPVAALHVGTDSTEVQATNGEVAQKHGVRLALGGFAGVLAIGKMKEYPSYPVYGAHAGLRIPVSKHTDLIGAVEYAILPERNYTKEQVEDVMIDPALDQFNWFERQINERTITIPASRLASAQLGMRWHQRMGRRSGFHMGFHSSILYGWHTRTIRTLPEYWPDVNVPAESMVTHEQAFQRWYWSPIGVELGWSFNGRVDLFLVTEAPATTLDNTEYYGAGFLIKGLLSVVVGRTGEAGTKPRP